jgi:DNA-binding transcriptional regulator YhcF (GntR family)
MLLRVEGLLILLAPTLLTRGYYMLELDHMIRLRRGEGHKIRKTKDNTPRTANADTESTLIDIARRHSEIKRFSGQGPT